MRVRTIGKAILIWILVISCIPFCAGADGAADSEAPELTERCTFRIDDGPVQLVPQALTDLSYETYFTLRGGRRIDISWEDGAGIEQVFIEFHREPENCTVLQYDAAGSELSREVCPVFMYHLVRVEKDARTITIAPAETAGICSLRAYGTGSVPNWHPWDYSLRKLDYMIIAMHPDDDVLFMGAIAPIYGAEQGKEGRIVYCSPALRIRMNEAQNGAWAMGLRIAPLFGPYGDFPSEENKNHEQAFQVWEVTRYVVRLLRKHRPEVVFSHDLFGEYGHWQHKRLSQSVLQAVEYAADPTYDPYSVELFGVWRVKKLYLHLYAQNRIELPVTEPLAAFDGKNAVEVATEAFACHASQSKSRHAVRNEGVYSLADFGLAYTTVGEDTPGVNDPFEHVSATDIIQNYMVETFDACFTRFFDRLKTETHSVRYSR